MSQDNHSSGDSMKKGRLGCRKSHQKSRLGCTFCKRRRIKVRADLLNQRKKSAVASCLD